MATGTEVLRFLLPEGGWFIEGDKYEGIQFLECEPITKEQFTAGFAEYDAWKAQKDAEKATAKAALLTQLGITEDQAKLLLS